MMKSFHVYLQQQGYDVICAASGPEALSLLESWVDPKGVWVRDGHPRKAPIHGPSQAPYKDYRDYKESALSGQVFAKAL